MEKIFEITDMKIRLGQNVAAMFDQNDVVFLRCLAQSQGMSKIMTDAYDALVYKQKLCPMERLPREIKLDKWKTAKELANGTIDHNRCVLFAKQLWAVEYFLTGRNGL